MFEIFAVNRKLAAKKSNIAICIVHGSKVTEYFNLT
jgi:hypothetical protein